MQKLFGTDGIRGLADQFPLDKQTVNIIGAALARHFSEKLGRKPRFISGRDTRESGARIENALHAGASAYGANCESAGVITTPGVAYLTRAFDFDAGVVISASHNPYQDNGIKIFTPDGTKLESGIEKEIEGAVFRGETVDTSAAESNSERTGTFCQSYLDHLIESSGGDSAAGKKVVIDCANGAASWLAPELFNAIGGAVIAINNSPDGRNINEKCGSLHLEGLAARVVEERAHLGIAFDGDADRALFVDGNGTIVDGDATLWLMAQFLKGQGKLKNNTVVATVMSNIGLELGLKELGIDLIRTAVGDKYVLESLIKTGSEIGGEQSGHIIFPEKSLVGDGMMTSLLLLEALKHEGASLADAAKGFIKYPQILLNVPVRSKRPFEDVPEVVEAAKVVEAELSGDGRLLLRYSGTESLARVMIEGKDQLRIEDQAHRLAKVISGSLG